MVLMKFYVTVLMKFYVPVLTAIVGIVVGPVLVGMGYTPFGVGVFATAIVLFVVAVAVGSRLEAPVRGTSSPRRGR
jgi:hypothetical protein